MRLVKSLRRLSASKAWAVRGACSAAPLVRCYSDYVFRSPFDDIPIPNESIDEYVTSDFDALGDKLAIKDVTTGQQLTYAELQSMILRLASGLRARGFKAGDTLAVNSPNNLYYPAVFHAVSRLGGRLTTTNPLYEQNEVEFQFHDAAATHIACHPLVLNKCHAVAKTLKIDDVIVMGDVPPGVQGATPITSVLDDGHTSTERANVDPLNDVAVVPYSSGTTGLPKGVLLTHTNLVSNVAQFMHVLDGVRPDDKVIAILPYFHIYGMQVVMNCSLKWGLSQYIMPMFNFEQFLQTIHTERISIAYVAPPVLVALAKSPAVRNYDLSSLRLIMSGAAPLGAALEEEIQALIPTATVFQGYGMTESSPVTFMNSLGKIKHGTIGIAVPNVTYKVVDVDTLQPVGPGSEGELRVKGPNVMPGYLNRPQATVDSFDEEGFLRTGDIVRVDWEGYATVTDRLKELVKYKGFQVAPAELESLLMTHPSVADAAVIGSPCDFAGELPTAFVVKKQGHDLCTDEISMFVATKVSEHKHLRGGVHVVDTIPKSATGKILRRVLKDKVVQEHKEKKEKAHGASHKH